MFFRKEGIFIGKKLLGLALETVISVLASFCVSCYPDGSYNIYTHRSEFSAFQKEKTLPKVIWETVLFFSTGKGPTNGH